MQILVWCYVKSCSMSKNYITNKSKFTSELQGAIKSSFTVTNFDVEACNRRSLTELTFKIKFE